MTDYLEEALEGLDTLVRRLRRIGTSTADREKNIGYFPKISRNIESSSGENSNVSDTKRTVDETEFAINRNMNKVYNMDMAGRSSPWGDAIGEDGGGATSWGAAIEDTAGSEAILRPAELGKAPVGQDGGRDSAPVPPRGPGAEWISGEGAEAWVPVGETGASGPPASEEMRWAEQADRAFRRDSRRYDGGFYLH